jgi:hypothetical protein
MPAKTTPIDVPRRRPHDWGAPAEPPPARGLGTVWVDRFAVVGLGVCVVALLLRADALDAGVVVATGAAGAALCWLVGVVGPIAGGVIESLLGLVGIMLGAGVGGWHVVRTGVTATGVVGLVTLLFGLVLLALGLWHLLRGVRGWCGCWRYLPPSWSCSSCWCRSRPRWRPSTRRAARSAPRRRPRTACRTPTWSSAPVTAYGCAKL